MEIPITDNHAHINPLRGLGFKAIEQFHSAGGKNIILVNLLTKSYGRPARSINDFNFMYHYHIRIVKDINTRYNVRAYAVIGPHPAELTEMLKRNISLNSAVRLLLKAIDLAVDLLKSGEGIALGEVGRPHYEVPKEVLAESNKILQYALEKAAEFGLPVQIHMETPNEDNLNEIGEFVDRAGLRRDKVIIHHAPPIIKTINKYGFVPSLVAKEGYIKIAIKEGGKFLLETDYLDDPRRPGAVLSLRTIPRNLNRLLKQGIISPEVIKAICVDIPEQVYGVKFH